MFLKKISRFLARSGVNLYTFKLLLKEFLSEKTILITVPCLESSDLTLCLPVFSS